MPAPPVQQSPPGAAKPNAPVHPDTAVATAPVAQDFDATISYIEGLVPSLYVTLELVRVLGHTMPPSAPPPA